MARQKKATMKEGMPKSNLPKPKGVRKAPKTKKSRLRSTIDAVRKSKATISKSLASLLANVMDSPQAHGLNLLKPKGIRKASKTKESTSFLSLSGELRNMIYEQALVYDEKILVIWGENKKKRNYRIRGPARPPTGVPPLLQVSRQIRQEGLSIFYSRNTFAFHEDNQIKQRDRNYEIRMEQRLWWLFANTTAWRFQRWCNFLGDNLKWVRKLHLCYRSRDEKNMRVILRGDLFPYVKFAAQRPDMSITVTSEENTDCGCIKLAGFGSGPELAQLADKMAILKEQAWIDNVRAGNIVGFLGEIVPRNPHLLPVHNLFQPLVGDAWKIKVREITYKCQASQPVMDEDDWQELCEKLSLPYTFVLVRKNARGPTGFGMVVEAKPEVIELDN